MAASRSACGIIDQLSSSWDHRDPAREINRARRPHERKPARKRITAKKKGAAEAAPRSRETVVEP
jgi:hypothetical protein